MRQFKDKEMTLEETAEQLKKGWDDLEPKKVLGYMETAFGVGWEMKHPCKRKWRHLLEFFR